MIKYSVFFQGEEKPVEISYKDTSDMKANLEKDLLPIGEEKMEAGLFTVSINTQDGEEYANVAYATGGMKELTTEAADKLHKVIDEFSGSPFLALVNMTEVHSQIGSIMVPVEQAQAVANKLKEILSDEQNYEAQEAKA